MAIRVQIGPGLGHWLMKGLFGPSCVRNGQIKGTRIGPGIGLGLSGYGAMGSRGLPSAAPAVLPLFHFFL